MRGAQGAVLLLLALVAVSHPLIADEEGQWQHGVSNFDEFKYGPDFEHFDYANPDAPKGGTLVLSTGFDFTSFTPFLPFGTPAVGALAPGILYDALFVRANDEAFSVYGNLAKHVRFADDLSEVTVQLHPEAYWQRCTHHCERRAILVRSRADEGALGCTRRLVDHRVGGSSRRARTAASIQTDPWAEQEFVCESGDLCEHPAGTLLAHARPL